jgi:DNA replication protein DnaC
VDHNLSDEQYDRLTRNFPYPRDGSCPTCGGAKEYRLDGEDRPCNCERQRNLSRLYYSANLPRRFHQLDGNDFEERYNQLNDDVVTPVNKYLTDLKYNYHYGLGLGFQGPLGTGKTLVATHILKAALKQGFSGYFIQFKDLFHAWAAAWKDDESKEEVEVYMKRANFLVLDELISDPRNNTGYLTDGLEAIMRHRYNNNLPTILTTNMTEDQISVEFGRPYSLISGVTTWLTMKGVDYRPISLANASYLVEQHEVLPVK